MNVPLLIYSQTQSSHVGLILLSHSTGLYNQRSNEQSLRRSLLGEAIRLYKIPFSSGFERAFVTLLGGPGDSNLVAGYWWCIWTIGRFAFLETRTEHVLLSTLLTQVSYRILRLPLLMPQ